jgi:hypothetical protein
VPKGVNLYGTKPNPYVFSSAVIDGNTTPGSGSSLILSGRNKLSWLHVTGFGGPQIKTLGGGNTMENTTIRASKQVVYNLVDKASSANWTTYYPETVIPFNGSDDDSRGFAVWRSNYPMTNGSLAPLSLETHPKRTETGVIKGCYKNMQTSGYTFQPDDRLVGTVGFRWGSVAGNVDFWVIVQMPQNHKVLGVIDLTSAQREARYFNYSLKEFVGKNGYICILVQARQDSVQNWAVWQELKIVR